MLEKQFWQSWFCSLITSHHTDIAWLSPGDASDSFTDEGAKPWYSIENEHTIPRNFRSAKRGMTGGTAWSVGLFPCTWPTVMAWIKG
jgi:hypothetical protein